MKLILYFLSAWAVLFTNAMHMIIKKIEHCDPQKDYPMQLYLKPYIENNEQYLDGNISFRIPLSNYLRDNILVELAINKRYMKVIDIKERNACTTMHRYLGEFVYDIERAVGLTPGLCPIPVGRYRFTHLLMETNKISLQSLPLGKLRVTIEKSLQKETVLCLRADVENV